MDNEMYNQLFGANKEIITKTVISSSEDLEETIARELGKSILLSCEITDVYLDEEGLMKAIAQEILRQEKDVAQAKAYFDYIRKCLLDAEVFRTSDAS